MNLKQNGNDRAKAQVNLTKHRLFIPIGQQFLDPLNGDFELVTVEDPADVLLEQARVDMGVGDRLDASIDGVPDRTPENLDLAGESHQENGSTMNKSLVPVIMTTDELMAQPVVTDEKTDPYSIKIRVEFRENYQPVYRVIPRGSIYMVTLGTPRTGRPGSVILLTGLMAGEKYAEKTHNIANEAQITSYLRAVQVETKRFRADDKRRQQVAASPRARALQDEEVERRVTRKTQTVNRKSAERASEKASEKAAGAK